MADYLKRLATTGAAYTASSVISKLIAVALLPLYTRYLTRVDYGAAEVLLAAVVAFSIVVRLGIIEALLRFYYRFDDRREQDEVVRTSFVFLLVTSTLGALIAAAFAGPLSEFLLDRRDTTLMLIAVFGLWVFTNYEFLMVLFRLDERAVSYFAASISNVLLTIVLTVILVVIADEGAKGLLLGNFAATGAILLALAVVQRRRIVGPVAPEQLGPLLRFGLPTMPGELSLYALNFVDRIVLVRSVGLAEAGLYSLAVKFSQVVTVFVRGFNLAWPPLAYSIKDDAEARRTYAFIVTYFLLIAAFIVLALSLEARWVARALAAPAFFGSYKAVPLVATGATMYALYLVLAVVVGRSGRTGYIFPVTAVALGTNVVLNVLLVPELEIVGAGLALVGSYLVMLALMYAVTRRLFPVPFQWSRMLRIVVVAGGLFALGETLLPTTGADGFLLRAALTGAYPFLLWAGRFFQPQEIAAARAIVVRARSRVGASAEASEDLKSLRSRTELMDDVHDA